MGSAVGVKEGGGKVTLWGQLRQAFRPKSKGEGAAYRMDVHATALATDAKPALEKNSMSGERRDWLGSGGRARAHETAVVDMWVNLRRLLSRRSPCLSGSLTPPSPS